MRAAVMSQTCRGVFLLAGLLLAVGAQAASRSFELPAPPPVPAGAFGEGGFDGEQDRVAVRLLTEANPVRAGDTVRVGVLFDLDPGWHIYWRSPGDSGLPTELHWEALGAAIGPIQWTAPRTFAEADGLITTYGYSDRVLLYSDARVSSDARGSVPLQVTTHFLVCEITCVPGKVTLQRTLAIGEATEPAASEVTALFDAAAAARPVGLSTLGLEAQVLYSQSGIRAGDEFTAAIALGCHGQPNCSPPRLSEGDVGYAFIADLVESVELTVSGWRPHPLSPGDVLIELTGRAGAAEPSGPQRLTGVVGLRDPSTGAAVAAELDLPLPRAALDAAISFVTMPWDDAPAARDARDARKATDAAGAQASATAPPPPPASIPLGRALLFALLGGLILNAMPCVLPVLAIKVFSMTELASHGRREVLAHGAAYGAGVVGSMLVLAAVVVALQAGGESVGWGFQFQEPVFVAAISAVLVVFALNLFGAFEIFVPTGSLAGVGAAASGPRRSFFEGLLAVVLATPCSAPFLGTAVGFAFAGGTATVFGIFAAIGIGLAAPFVLVTLVPAWARFIPRSGAWMGTLRAGLGFAVLATVVWLLWVVGRLVGTDGLAALLALLVAVAFAAWLFGRLQAAGRTLPARGVALSATIAGVLLLLSLPFDASPPATAATTAPDSGHASRTAPWEPAALQNTLAAGRPAFVYFTADWCITCKVNERGTLASDSVLEALEELDVQVFRGDWTQRDAAIAQELARFGKGGVPMYLVYDPDAPDRPAVLPELLTPNTLVEALRAAASPRG